MLETIVVFLSLPVLASFMMGMIACKQAFHARNSQRVTLALLALFLIEPLPNTIFVFSQFLLWYDITRDGRPWWPITTSVAVLLLPALGLALSERGYARICGWLATIGAARFATSALTIGLFTHDPVIEPPLVLLLVGEGLLIASVVWGRWLLRGPLAVLHEHKA